jgi:hypothetical protein
MCEGIRRRSKTPNLGMNLWRLVRIFLKTIKPSIGAGDKVMDLAGQTFTP